MTMKIKENNNMGQWTNNGEYSCENNDEYYDRRKCEIWLKIIANNNKRKVKNNGE